MGRNCLIFVALSVSVSVIVLMCTTSLFTEASGDVYIAGGDLREVYLGQKKSFSLSIRNRTAKPVKIKNATGDCSCIDVRVTKDQLAPGESCSIEGTLAGPSETGDFKKTIAVQTNSHGLLRASLTGTARERVACFPKRIVCASGTGEAKLTLTVRNSGDETIEVLSCTPIGFRYTSLTVAEQLPLKIQARSSVKISVRASGMPYMKDDGKLRLNTSHELEPHKTLDVSVRPPQYFSVVPRSVNLGIVDFSSPAEDSIRLTFDHTLSDPENLFIRLDRVPDFLTLINLTPKEAVFRVKNEFSPTGVTLDGIILFRIGTAHDENELTIPVNVLGVARNG